MQFYSYKGDYELGKEPLGSDNRVIWRDLKSYNGAKLRAKKLFKDEPYRLYSFTNFFDDRTFKRVV